MADVNEVIPFDPAPYESVPSKRLYFGREVFYKLELFKLDRFERIVYFDCDTLVVGDISALWDPSQFAERSFYAVRETASMGVAPALHGKFNTGVMVINRPLLGEGVHARLLEIAESGVSYDGGDQGVIHAYLEEAGARVTGELDSAYNVLVRAKKEGDWDAFKDRLKVLHFVNGLKPWSEEHRHDWLFDEEFKRLWDDAYRFAPGDALSTCRSSRR